MKKIPGSIDPGDVPSFGFVMLEKELSEYSQMFQVAIEIVFEDWLQIAENIAERFVFDDSMIIAELACAQQNFVFSVSEFRMFFEKSFDISDADHGVLLLGE